ncbi:MAG: hypothetical protein HQK49_03295 [Oligoflexia bacterium]|nr:hypothetical protein [Oligoflexia bacterium]
MEKSLYNKLYNKSNFEIYLNYIKKKKIFFFISISFIIINLLCYYILIYSPSNSAVTSVTSVSSVSSVAIATPTDPSLIAVQVPLKIFIPSSQILKHEHALFLKTSIFDNNNKLISALAYIHPSEIENSNQQQIKLTTIFLYKNEIQKILTIDNEKNFWKALPYIENKQTKIKREEINDHEIKL